MDKERWRRLLVAVQQGDLDVDSALAACLPPSPEEDLGFAVIDHQRMKRCGFPEVIFGQNKSADEIATLLDRIHARHGRSLATRVDPDKAAHIIRSHPSVRYHDRARMLSLGGFPEPTSENSRIAVITAGTSDGVVGEEAALTAEWAGHPVDRIFDVGVAGLHRLLSRMDRLRAARVLIVVAGMEGALPSVVAGMVSRPVIAVPTSVGYGASFGGLAALLAMLNSCASGVTVVNIDNGFGAAYAASLIAGGS